jgi:hypothetical protein
VRSVAKAAATRPSPFSGGLRRDQRGGLNRADDVATVRQRGLQHVEAAAVIRAAAQPPRPPPVGAQECRDLRLGVSGAIDAAIRRDAQRLGHRHATPEAVRRQTKGSVIGRVEQHQSLIAVNHGDTDRHGFEHGFGQHRGAGRAVGHGVGRLGAARVVCSNTIPPVRSNVATA